MQQSGGINFDKYEDIPVEVLGKDVPSPIRQFPEAQLHDTVLENVLRCGYTKPTPVQKYSIPVVLSGRDLMSCAQTGSGKTAAFLLPIVTSILREPTGTTMQTEDTRIGRSFLPFALVLAPTRELAIQIHKESMKFTAQTGLVPAILYGGRENYRDQINKIRLGCHILIATPGRLLDVINQGFIGLKGCRYLVLDEADRMLDMGFEPQIRQIFAANMPNKHCRLTAMFSATFPKEIRKLAQDFMKDEYVFLSVGRVGSTSENITQNIQWVEEMDKLRVLCALLNVQEGLTLVFVETKRAASNLAYQLNRGGVSAVSIHGDLKQFERERNLQLFQSGTSTVLVATAVAARGLDIPDVRLVVNYDLPGDIDEYVHRIGRTGRCGNTGVATSFFNDKNRNVARNLLNLLTEAQQVVPEWLTGVASSSVSFAKKRTPMNGGMGGASMRRFTPSPQGFGAFGGGFTSPVPRNSFSHNNNFSSAPQNQPRFNSGGGYPMGGPQSFAPMHNFGGNNVGRGGFGSAQMHTPFNNRGFGAQQQQSQAPHQSYHQQQQHAQPQQQYNNQSFARSEGAGAQGFGGGGFNQTAAPFGQTAAPRNDFNSFTNKSSFY